MNNKRILVMITEGETDEEFYKKALLTIKSINNISRFNFGEIKYMCAKSITKIQKKILNKFKKEICFKYQDYEKVVCFCYDYDVFEFNANPPINRKKLKQEFKEAGANKIIEIIAKQIIEDFFLYDVEGIKKYLRLPRSYKVPVNKKGLELLKAMFACKNRVYYKGEKVEGLVSSLDMKLIFRNICPQMHELCSELGSKCKKEICQK